jgi:dihydroorotase
LIRKFKDVLRTDDGSFKSTTIHLNKDKLCTPGKADKVQVCSVSQSVSFSGLIDLGTMISDPGHEYRETLIQTCQAARAGGYQCLLGILPADMPSEEMTTAKYLLSKSGHYSGVRLMPIAHLTRQSDGENMVEFLDLHHAGVIAFYDGIEHVRNAGVLLRSLEYVKSFDGIVITSPTDLTILPHGQMNEGKVSTMLGLPGLPAITEEMIVHRDIQLARLTGSRLHIYCISTAGSVELIRKAKKEGVRVTCSVSVNNLLFSEEDLAAYDTNLKVLPPLREKKTNQLLWKALKDGTIDIIVSQHIPLEPELKDKEFYFADFGAMGLETAVPALLSYFGRDEAAPVIQAAMHDNVKSIFGLDIDTGIVIFGASEQRNYPQVFNSNCYNSPFTERELTFVRID